MIQNNLSSFRKLLSLNKKDFGLFLNVSGTTITNWENGKTKIPIDVLVRIGRIGGNENFITKGVGNAFSSIEELGNAKKQIEQIIKNKGEKQDV